MQYEWDETKNRRNQAKHDGISFELAALVFEDESCLVGLDCIDETGESRWHAIGAVRIGPEATSVLVVVHEYRENRYGKEIIRIIAARRAEKHEIRRYQDSPLE